MSSRAKGPGNLFVYVGARTGRDGIHGASMASESFDGDPTADKKTCVQIGDPFYGKLLMEACLEVMKKKLVVAAQDMGAAGLISSSFEMITKGSVGMRLHLDHVPLRDATMTPEEILLSESQERVLLLVHPDQYNQLEQIFTKWGLPVCVIGELKKEKKVELFWKEELLLKIDPQYLTEKAPRYKRPYHDWSAKHHTKNREQTKCSLSKEQGSILLSLLKDVRGCSRKFIYRQYDQRVGTRTVKDCTFPFGLARLPESGRALALCMGGRPHIMRMDSLEGGKDTVYEPALQLAARGFTPLALTDGLNFGSPEKDEVMSSFVACVEGMSVASRSLETPVVSGNVSFYNETQGEGISPTPATTMIGVKDSLNTPSDNTLDTSEDSSIYLVSAHQIFSKGMVSDVFNKSPAFHGTLNSEICKTFIHQVLKASSEAPPEAVSVVGKFGLAYTLARMLIKGVDSGKNVSNKSKGCTGIEINTDYDPFQERLYEMVVVLKKSDISSWEKCFTSHSHFKMEKLGTVIKEPVLSFNKNISLSVFKLKEAYETGWNVFS